MGFTNFVTITAKPGQAQTIVDHLKKITAEVLESEPGTKQYHPAQSTENKDIIYVWEQYEDDAALDAHRKNKAYLEFGKNKNDLIANLKIERCETISSKL